MACRASSSAACSRFRARRIRSRSPTRWRARSRRRSGAASLRPRRRRRPNSTTMLDRTDGAETSAAGWLAQFQSALEQGGLALTRLFHPDSHWRDVLALTWNLRTVSGGNAIVKELTAHADRALPTAFRIARGRAAPRRVRRAGAEVIEAIF